MATVSIRDCFFPSSNVPSLSRATRNLFPAHFPSKKFPTFFCTSVANINRSILSLRTIRRPSLPSFHFSPVKTAFKPNPHAISRGTNSDTDNYLDISEIDAILRGVGAIKDQKSEEARADDDDDDDADADEGEPVSHESPSAEPESLSVERLTMVERVYRLVDKVQKRSAKEGSPTIKFREIADIFEYPVDKFQRLAVEAFLRGSSVVVSAPTSSGKTLIAESAAAAVLANGRRLFYTTPLKALSNQKLRDFREQFGEQNVGLLTGDAAINRDAPIVIMTTEILRNMLYSSVGSEAEDGDLARVQAVVLDEVHYLSDVYRGTVWEESIIYCPKKVQLICLSATVANPDELADWIGQVHGPTELVTSSRRPVPLEWHFSTKFALCPLLNEEKDGMNRELLSGSSDEWVDEYSSDEWTAGKVKPLRSRGFAPEASRRSRGAGRRDSGRVSAFALSPDRAKVIRRRQVPRLMDTLTQLRSRDMLPAIWFIFSRRGCDAAVSNLSQESSRANLLTRTEAACVQTAVTEFRAQFPDAVREDAVEPLSRGLAAHHAGLLPAWKGLVEELFQKGLVKVVFATETLAAGINMPARSVVLSSLSKRGDAGMALLSSNSLLQMAGRAGRRGKDRVGHAVVLQSPFEGAPEACQILLAGPDPLVSQFTATYGMALNLLSGGKSLLPLIVNPPAAAVGTEILPEMEQQKEGGQLSALRSMEEARSLVERSFGNYLGNEVVLDARSKIDRMQARILQLSQELHQGRQEGAASLLSSPAWADVQQKMALLTDQEAALEAVTGKARALRSSMVEAAMAASLDKALLAVIDTGEGGSSMLPVLCLEQISRPAFVSQGGSSGDAEEGGVRSGNSDAHYIGLAGSNRWYIFSSPAVLQLCQLESSAGKYASWREKADPEAMRWRQDSDCVWSSDGRISTMAWCSTIPARLSLAEGLLQESEELIGLEKEMSQQSSRVEMLRKDIQGSEGSRMHRQLELRSKKQEEKIARLQTKSQRLLDRLAKIQPTGWKEFVQVVNVLQKTMAVSEDLRQLLPLGQTASVIRGSNELWLAVAIADPSLGNAKPHQLAGVCAALVTEGLKGRSDSKTKQDEEMFQPSDMVLGWVDSLSPIREQLIQIQLEENVMIPCLLDASYCGLVEAWTLGVSWKELTESCGLDEGDVARLLRRTIDLLSQIPFLPNVSLSTRKTARQAAVLMDRAPISELVD